MPVTPATHERGAGPSDSEQEMRDRLAATDALRRRGDCAEALESLLVLLAREPRSRRLLLRQVELLQALGRLDEARDVLAPLLAQQSPHAETLRVAAALADASGDREGAIGNYERAAALRPDRAATHRELGRLHFAGGNRDAAEAAYLTADRLEPGDPAVRVALGEIATDRGDTAGAMSHFAAALVRRPGDHTLRRRLADLLMQSGRLAEAEEHVLLLLSTATQAETTFSLAGRLAIAKGDRSQAIAHCRRACELRPELVRPKRILRGLLAEEARAAATSGPDVDGDAQRAAVKRRSASKPAKGDKPSAAVGAALRSIDDLIRQGKNAEAVAILQPLLAVEPVPEVVLRRAGALWAAEGDLEAALDFYRRAAAARPKSHYALLAAARILASRGEIDEAEQFFRAVLEIRPNEERAFVGLADVARQRGRDEDAAEWIERVAAAQPGSIRLLLKGAAEFTRLDRSERATQKIDAALALDPDNADALVALGTVAAKQNDMRTAADAFEAALLRDPGSVRAWTGATDVAVKSQSGSSALETLSRARAAVGSDVALDRKAVDVLLGLGRVDKAQRILDEALNRFPKNDWLQAQRTSLNLALGRFSDVEATLAGYPSQTRAQRTAHAMLEGRLEAVRWRLDAAAAAFERAIAISPEHAPAHAALADILIARLQPLEARRHLAIEKRLTRTAQAAKGRSLNPSQSLSGQIMTETWANTSALALGRAAIESGDLADALAAVRLEPDYTPNAILLMVQLRQNDYLSTRPVPAAARSGIPNQIFQYWHAEKRPEDVIELTDSWRACNPGWKHTCHSDVSARAYLESLGVPELTRAYRRARSPAQKSDLIRLAILFHEGGIYADADDRCLASLSGLFDGRGLVISQENRGSIGNNFIAARPRHPLLGRALELAMEAMLRGDSETIWLSTGPGLLTRTLAAFVAQEVAHFASLGRDIVVLERFEMRRFCWMNCRVAYKQVGHWSRTEFGQATDPMADRRPAIPALATDRR